MKRNRLVIAVSDQVRNADIEIGLTFCSETRPSLLPSVLKNRGGGVPNLSKALRVKAAPTRGPRQETISSFHKNMNKHAPMTAVP
jgi:hypothetical protein